MENVFGWIGTIMQRCGKLIPTLVIVCKDELAVKLRQGKVVVPVGPGLHWYWPLLTEWRKVTACRQILAPANQHLVTLDRQTVTCSVLVAYIVVDQVKYLVDNQDADNNISDLTMAVVRDIVVSRSLDDLVRFQNGSLNDELLQGVRNSVLPFGVDVETVRLTNLAPSLVLRLLN